MATSRRQVTPGEKSRDLQRELTALEKQEPSAERAADLATLARAAHVDRQLNLAMRAAELCLADDPSDPELLVAAYHGEPGGEDLLEELVDLRDLARYLDRADISEVADNSIEAAAREWVIAGDDSERRYRLRTVQSIASPRLADELRDELDVM